MRREEKVEAVVHSERVVHPEHYNWIPGIECFDVVENFNYHLGNVIAYIWRFGRKPSEDPIEDLRKAKFHLDREIERLEGMDDG